MIKDKINEILFWLHSLVIGAYVSIGLYLSLQWVLLITLLHRLHLRAFGGCLLSKLQHKLNGLPKDMDCIGYGIYRFTGKMISKKQERIFDYTIVSCCFIIALFFA